MIDVKIEGIDRLEQMANKFAVLFSPQELEIEVLRLADKAGEALLGASVRACIEAIYDLPEFTYDRTMALLDAHTVVDTAQGPSIFERYITIDPSWPAEGDVHNDREYVMDYAFYVHNGYTQWVWGHDTGQFVEGRMWFEVALAEAFPTVVSFVALAFKNHIYRLCRELTI